MNFLLTISVLSREMVMRVDKMITINSLEKLYVDIGASRLILIVTKTRLAIAI